MGAYAAYLGFFFALFFGLPIYLIIRGIRAPRADWRARAAHSAPFSVAREPTAAELRSHRFRLWVALVVWAGLGCLIAAVTLHHLLSRPAGPSGGPAGLTTETREVPKPNPSRHLTRPATTVLETHSSPTGPSR